MRKILLATASASVLCTFAMQAQAQVVVTLGGYTEFFGGLFNDSLGPNRNKREFELETEIVVKADGKADNGLLYGAKVELQNSTPATPGGNRVGTDEASIYVGGTWGRFELGDFDGAADTLKIYAPVIGIEQIDGDYSDFAGAPPNFGIHIPNSSDATKIMYLTPRIAGFQAGASYTPESDNEAQSVVPLKNASQYRDFAEFGANYTGEFSGLGVQLGATLTTAEGQPTTVAGSVKDFTAWNVGALLTFGEFALGGGYVDAGDFKVPTAGAIDNNQDVWHVGFSYTTGPVAIAASYMEAEGYSDANGGYSTDYKAYGVGATYTVAPDLLLETDLMYFQDDFLTGTRGATTKGGNDGYVFVVGTLLNF
jgi:outer membrane protein OmpU